MAMTAWSSRTRDRIQTQWTGVGQLISKLPLQRKGIMLCMLRACLQFMAYTKSKGIQKTRDSIGKKAWSK